MKTENKYEKNSYDQLKCIWMTVNVVDYKLCDRNFDCENCPFDKVMRNYSLYYPETGEMNLIDRLIEKINSETFQEKIIYIRNNLILKHLFSSTYYLGISPIAKYLIDCADHKVYCRNSDIILKGEAIMNLRGNWGNVSIISPLNITVDSFDIPENNAGEKWLAIINTEQSDIYNSEISQYNWKKNQANLLKFLTGFKTKFPEAGTLMQDGGTEVKYIYQVTGKREYLKILKDLFSS